MIPHSRNSCFEKLREAGTHNWLSIAPFSCERDREATDHRQDDERVLEGNGEIALDEASILEHGPTSRLRLRLSGYRAVPRRRILDHEPLGVPAAFDIEVSCHAGADLRSSDDFSIALSGVDVPE
jgi:hypothetical protein